MSAKHFIDTNIFVYSFSEQEVKKQKIARNIIKNALEESNGIVSMQVVSEFFNVATRKFQPKLTYEFCLEYCDTVFKPMCLVFPDFDILKIAFQIQIDHKISFYDSLIVAAALVAKCKTVYSEDLQNGMLLGNGLDKVRIVNPFI